MMKTENSLSLSTVEMILSRSMRLCDKNSGRLGGKFMERKKHKSPVSQDLLRGEETSSSEGPFSSADYKFQLLKADEYTEKYMEDNPDQFPEASINSVLRKIKKGSSAFKNLQEYVISLIA